MRTGQAKLYQLAEGTTASGPAIIFVHGLRGDPDRTWRRKNAAHTLADLLRQDPELQEASCYSFGYRTGLSPFQYDFKSVAELLRSEIRARLTGRRLVFIAHSMGGLAVQQYVVDRFEASDTGALGQIRGIVYLAVPFGGSALANLIPRWAANKQLQSLRKKSQPLSRLEDSWTRYRAHTGANPENLPIDQLILRGERDFAVAKLSASPLYVGAEVCAIDETHTGISKLDADHTALLTIRQFIARQLRPASRAPDPFVLHIHGFVKQHEVQEATISLDWTPYFRATSPRKLPSDSDWMHLSASLDQVSTEWAGSWTHHGGRLRLHARLSLPGGIMVGSRFCHTRGAVLEVQQDKELWSSQQAAPSYRVHKTEHNQKSSPLSRVAVIVLSVSNSIEIPVLDFLQQSALAYRSFLSLAPPSGAKQDSIANAEEAVAFAKEVKREADRLKADGIEELYLFLNGPFAVSVFVGHYLTALSPIQVFDYAHPGYRKACRI
ncbi:alpha/beta fold hydrolase [Paenibacillus puerhi]|uniref:alpha/beta fold hydrolase n=1 Tax=Paenibacillus puerhi TaxID=2692622 RepID=UPI001357DF44|nr:alpha/beta fold hydrolase [Paenibacillus puerhi]